MSDPLTTAAGVSFGIATAAAPAAGVDYGIIFGAFIGAMFYVTQAKDIPRIRQAFSFVVSFGTGVLGASVTGAKLAGWLNYNDTPLEPLGALIISAVAVKLLTFISEKMGDPTSLFSKWRGGSCDEGNHLILPERKGIWRKFADLLASPSLGI